MYTKQIIFKSVGQGKWLRLTLLSCGLSLGLSQGLGLCLRVLFINFFLLPMVLIFFSDCLIKISISKFQILR